MTALAVGMIVAFGMAFVAARLSRLWAGVLWGMVILLVLGVVWFLSSSFETQLQTMETASTAWGLVTGALKLVCAAAMFWCVVYVWQWASNVPERWGCAAMLVALAVTAVLVLLGLFLVLLGLADIFV